MKGHEVPFCSILFDIFLDLTGLLQWISGVILIRSVFKIRSFFKDHHEIVSLNVKRMTLHASAFIIYIVASISYFSTETLNQVMDNSFSLKLAEQAIVFNSAASFTAQILLILIFLELGKAEVISDSVSSASHSTSLNAPIVVESFDLEAEMHARIWNAF
jgi:hypothetical protein